MVRQEPDEELQFKIRPINLVMHNPNLFWVSPYDPVKAVQTLGGLPWLMSAGTGVALSLTYYKFSQSSIKSTFYVNTMRMWGRAIVGLAIGGLVGFYRFGDRQRLHNAYTSYRIRRRYKESINIETKDIWKYKGHKPHEEFYQWR